MPDEWKKSKAIKRKLKRATVCVYCKCQLTNENKTIDHKRPIDRGGSNHPNNIVIACNDCNAEKANMDYQSYLQMRIERNANEKNQLQAGK